MDQTQGSDGVGSMTNPEVQTENELSLVDILLIFAKHKKLMLWFPLGMAVIAAGITLILPNIFTAQTKILPPQNQSSSSVLIQQLGGLAGLAGGLTGLKTPNDMYIGMLKSRTVADNLIQRFNLKEVYDQEYQSVTRKQLERRSKILTSKDGIITIEVDDEDPQRAAEIANGYVDELFKLTKVLAVTEASQRRLFFERQLQEAKDNLASAEAAARQGLQTSGLVQVEGQGRAMVETTARLRGQITVKEVQIGAMRTFAAEGNPELKAAQTELAALKQQLTRMEGASGEKLQANGPDKDSGIGSVSLLRNVKYYETIFELLAKQYELAKIDEAKDSTVVQVMDKAIAPDRKSKPWRAMIVSLTAFICGLLAVVVAFAMESVERARRDERQAGQWARLVSYFR